MELKQVMQNYFFNAYLNTAASAWVRKQASAASFLNH